MLNRRAVGEWSPDSLSGLSLQVEQGASLTDLDGVYKTMPEVNGKYFEQTTGTKKPDIVTGAGGTTGIKNDGIDDVLVHVDGNVATLSGPFTAGVAFEAWSTDYVYFFANTGNNGNIIGLQSDTFWFWNSTGVTTVTNTLGLSLDTPYRAIMTRDSSDNLRCWLNGTEVTAAGTPNRGGAYNYGSLNARYASGLKSGTAIVSGAVLYIGEDHSSSVDDIDGWLEDTL